MSSISRKRPLAAVDHLLALSGDSGDPPHVARVHAVPVHSEGVGAVLEEGDAVTVAGVLDRG